MTPERLKLYLDGLVLKDDRDFDVVIKPRRGSRLGTYQHTKKQVIIYAAQDEPSLRLICVGLHELSHHLNWKQYGAEWVEMWRRHERIPRHGKAFKATLESLIGQWNFTYRELLKGKIKYDGKHPTRPPKFERFEKVECGENKPVEGIVRRENEMMKPKLSRMAANREIAKKKTQGWIDGVLVDVYTAHAIVTVYAALTKLHKVQFAEMDIKTQAAIALKLLAKYGT